MRLFPDQGSNPAPLTLGAQSLSHWTTREALQQLAKVKITSTVFSLRHSLIEPARCCSAPLASDLSWHFIVRESSHRRKCSQQKCTLIGFLPWAGCAKHFTCVYSLILLVTLGEHTLKKAPGDLLVVPWLRLHDPNVGDLTSILGQGTRSHILQQRS